VVVYGNRGFTQLKENFYDGEKNSLEDGCPPEIFMTIGIEMTLIKMEDFIRNLPFLIKY